MSSDRSALASWSPEQIALGRRWVQAWKRAGPELERLRREELRHLDPYTAIALLCGPADYRRAPRAPKPTSGLIEQQRLFRNCVRERSHPRNGSAAISGREPGRRAVRVKPQIRDDQG